MADDRPIDESTISGAPLTLDIAGKRYSIGRIRLCDLWALAQRIKDDRIATFFKHRAKMPSAEFASRVLADVIAREPSQQERMEKMLSPEGAAFLFWRCIVRYHPDISEDTVIEWCNGNPQLTDLILFESRVAQPAGGTADAMANPTPDASPQTG